MRAGPHLQLAQGARASRGAVSALLRNKAVAVAHGAHDSSLSLQAYAILDEIVMGGAVFETSSLEALRAFNEMQRCARTEADLFPCAAASLSADRHGTLRQAGETD